MGFLQFDFMASADFESADSKNSYEESSQENSVQPQSMSFWQKMRALLFRRTTLPLLPKDTERIFPAIEQPPFLQEQEVKLLLPAPPAVVYQHRQFTINFVGLRSVLFFKPLLPSSPMQLLNAIDDEASEFLSGQTEPYAQQEEQLESQEEIPVPDREEQQPQNILVIVTPELDGREQIYIPSAKLSMYCSSTIFEREILPLLKAYDPHSYVECTFHLKLWQIEKLKQFYGSFSPITLQEVSVTTEHTMQF